jgi:predicted cupin superfamily sugar epimerase
MQSDYSVSDLIDLLDLEPHPEGGHYRETLRDSTGGGGRAASTAIYFLLAAGEESRWHRIDATEVWHWYGGAPLLLSASMDGNETVELDSEWISPQGNGRKRSSREEPGNPPKA